MKRAFTLIELLIVVAIIAILAAIAVPNFLEAQVRSKVSRTKADMRTLATAIEAYIVDNNRAPFDFSPDVPFPYYLHSCISTPIAYVTTGHLILDVFAEKRQAGPGIQNPNAVRERYRYRAFNESYLSGGTPGATHQNLPGPDRAGNAYASQVVHGAWFLVSKGPDGHNNPLPAGFGDGANQTDWLWQVYDPTNGTISIGDIIRSQKQADVTGYPIPVTYMPLP
ncbi:MAG: prepilin-type N-terminal cleavage/methylation domain-containing protein [Candidatus Sumerlaeia bacterium]|nr:prepilin-type N-terminal cleavage/methylation domain-containing protein [Candidatus Sumerlaeia bacterium]